MKILASFDGTPFSESTLPLLGRMALLPEAEVILLRIIHEPGGRQMSGLSKTYSSSGQPGGTSMVIETPQTNYAETGEQAVERKLNELQVYLHGLAAQLPESATVRTEAHIHEHAAEAIIEQARKEPADVIVMATHGHGGLKRALFGSTVEAVIRSGVAPVLLVHPTES